MLKVAVIDDNQTEIVKIKEMCERYTVDTKTRILINEFTNGYDFIENYKADYDIIFLDIEMPHLNGMAVARKLQSLDSEAILVFITNLSQYAINGYEVGAYDYLLKPVSYEIFKVKLNKIKRVLDVKRKVGLAIQTENGYVRVDVDTLLYAESKGHYVYLKTINDEYRIRARLSDIEDKLNTLSFARANQSVLVNLQYINKIERNDIYIAEKIISISRSRKSEFMDKFTVFLGNGVIL